MEINNDTNNMFSWTAFYTEFADKLLPFKNNRAELLKHIYESYEILGMNYPFIDNGSPMDDICPFTVFGCFNKGITDENRISLMKTICSKLVVVINTPAQFEGVPVLNNMKARFFWDKKDRGADDISNLWDVFEAAIAYSDAPSDITKKAFVATYDKVHKIVVTNV